MWKKRLFSNKLYKWTGFRKCVLRWFSKLSENDRENAIHFIINKQRRAKKRIKAFENITITLIMALVTALISFFVLMCQNSISDSKERLEHEADSSKNTLYISAENELLIDDSLKESLINFGCTYDFTDKERPYIYIDKTVKSNVHYKDFVKQLNKIDTDIRDFKLVETMISRNNNDTANIYFFVGFYMILFGISIMILMAYLREYAPSLLEKDFYDDVLSILSDVK